MRSAMASSDAARRRLRGARSSRSRTTSDFEIPRPRDSASISATSGSGNRTVKVLMKVIVLRYWQACKTSRPAVVSQFEFSFVFAVDESARVTDNSECNVEKHTRLYLADQ